MPTYGRNRHPGKIDQVIGSGWVPEVVSDGALVALPMQEFGGATLYDHSGNGRNATLSTSYTLGASGPNGNLSVLFTGGYASIPYASWMNTAAITVEFWFKIPNIGTSNNLINRDLGGSLRPFAQSMNANGSINAYGNNQLGPVRTTVTTGLDDDSWHFFGWAVDSSGVGLYVVDNSVDSTYTGGGTITQPAGGDLLIGRNGFGGVNWGGSLAYVAIFPSKLTSTRLLAHKATIL